MWSSRGRKSRPSSALTHTVFTIFRLTRSNNYSQFFWRFEQRYSFLLNWLRILHKLFNTTYLDINKPNSQQAKSDEDGVLKSYSIFYMGVAFDCSLALAAGCHSYGRVFSNKFQVKALWWWKLEDGYSLLLFLGRRGDKELGDGHIPGTVVGHLLFFDQKLHSWLPDDAHIYTFTYLRIFYFSRHIYQNSSTGRV